MMLRLLTRFVFASFAALLLLTSSAPAQTADALNQIKKIYVDSFTGKLGGPELREAIINDLRKNPALEIVPDPAHADAVLRGTGEIWVRAYVSVSPRATNQYPVYGGYLSAQITGKDSETLWSYLVTPSKSSSSIRQDLANQVAKRMLAALHDSTIQPSPDQPAQHLGLTLKVAGATFPAPLYQAWFVSFQQRHPRLVITYDAIGSEAGIQQLRDGKLTFAASDVPLSPARMAQMPTAILQFATVLGAVVPVYNLSNVGRDLRFTPDVLAGIYMGKIRRWNDPRITAINHHVTLPDHEIVVVHRSDGGGTTFAWTDFLSKTSPEWKASVGSGTTVNWPVGKEARGNDEVATAVASTPDSIGYTELSFAIQRELSYGTVRNAAGNFVQANLLTLAAAANISRNESSIYSPLTNASGKDAYPITSLTWLLIPESMPDPATKSVVAEFLEWMLTAGQKECSALAYNPLPKEIVNSELQLLATFKSK
ncbi:phosphate ABC transporter substrate-binding protein PstS [Edaphobacter bradus]|uniref:phosphate ABC transporter substrate-binding protein PstS n=1 Tax=Edaphobacter bradus TaxID=2259016 RepID=UPI0021DFBA12|nr:phosphate ABC transporter substrate-binding protein PstS [Edaphobacter bradus]